MVLAIATTFIRRPTRDGATDSICTECLTIVCRSHSESDISQAEQDHRCDPRLLAYWESLSQPETGPAQS